MTNEEALKIARESLEAFEFVPEAYNAAYTEACAAALEKQIQEEDEQWNLCIECEEKAPEEAGWYRVIDVYGNEYTDYFFAKPTMTIRGVSYWKDSDFQIIAWKREEEK